MPRTLYRPATALAVPLLGLLTLLSACGGSTKTSSATSTTTTSAGSSFSAARTKFTSCLESHGVPATVATGPFGFRRGGNSSSSTSGPSSVPSSRPTIPTQYQSAYTACRSQFPTGSFRGGAGGNFNSPAFTAYLNCLAVHGVTVPTTIPGGGTPGGGTPPSSDLSGMRNQPAYAAAEAACQSLLPTPQGSASTTTPGT